ncbi:MAG TPA: pilus assembly protein FilA [Acinetobacter parvus]|jgi:hypothetical protein|uniref:DUF6160 family protein n=1 Tax=Acinetobacter parvus TaxID=134533 RepID=UPI002BFC7F62|nr:DUF6160 family protein [Acinetobacter parvus]HRM14771.1 pilus assembly protein FilA [Acinetobacter parvus]
MLKNKKLGCLSLLLLSPMAMAMQPLDDKSLSATTGQDGISLSVDISKVDFNQAAIIDTDGFTNSSATLAGKAALVMAATQGAASPTIGVDFVQTFKADGSIVYNPSRLLSMVVDSDAGAAANGGAFTNIALSFGNGVNGMRIRPFSVYLAPNAPGVISSLVGSTYTRGSVFNSGTTTLKSANIKELLRVSNNIDIKFVSHNKPTMNFQLGASPQGHMVMFGGAIDSVCGTGSGCNMMLVADYATAGDPSTAYGVGFDLQMSGEDANGFSLNGFYAGIEAGAGSIPGAVVFGNTGVSDKLNLNLNNVWLGDAGLSNPNTFNGLQNGSLGNIGAVGVSATNLKMRVSGM